MTHTAIPELQRLIAPQNLDLLIRDSQLDDILMDLLATGEFERVEQDINLRLSDVITKQVPRLHHTRYQPHDLSHINLWSESVYHLKVDTTELIQVLDVLAWNTNLFEERFGTVEETAYRTFSATTARGTRVMPQVKSSLKAVPVFIPSIPNMCDALADQTRYRATHVEDVKKQMGNRPGYHLSNFVRYLYLERPSQRQLLLSLMAERNRGVMEDRIDRFKRKPTLAVTKASMGMTNDEK